MVRKYKYDLSSSDVYANDSVYKSFKNAFDFFFYWFIQIVTEQMLYVLF